MTANRHSCLVCISATVRIGSPGRTPRWSRHRCRSAVCLFPVPAGKGSSLQKMDGLWCHSKVDLLEINCHCLIILFNQDVCVNYLLWRHSDRQYLVSSSFSSSGRLCRIRKEFPRDVAKTSLAHQERMDRWCHCSQQVLAHRHKRGKDTPVSTSVKLWWGRLFVVELFVWFRVFWVFFNVLWFICTAGKYSPSWSPLAPTARHSSSHPYLAGPDCSWHRYCPWQLTAHLWKIQQHIRSGLVNVRHCSSLPFPSVYFLSNNVHFLSGFTLFCFQQLWWSALHLTNHPKEVKKKKKAI